MVRGIPNISIPAIDYTVAHGSKMSLPVDSSSLVYSYFRHVSGIPAEEGTRGVSISKIHLLDVLIGQINQMKKSSPVALTSSNVPEESIDYLISNYKNQIRQAKAASDAMPYISTPSAQSGVLFNLIV